MRCCRLVFPMILRFFRPFNNLIYLLIQRLQISYVLCFVWHNPVAVLDESGKGFPSSFFSWSPGDTNLTARFFCFALASTSLVPLFWPIGGFAVSFTVDFEAPFARRPSLCEVNATLGLVLGFLFT